MLNIVSMVRSLTIKKWLKVVTNLRHLLVFGLGEVGRHATGQNDSEDGEDGHEDCDFADQGHVLVDYLCHLVVAPLAIDLRLVLGVAVEPLAARPRHRDRARQVAPVPVPVVAAALQLNKTVNRPLSEVNPKQSEEPYFALHQVEIDGPR